MIEENAEKLRDKIRALEGELAHMQRVEAARKASEERFRILFEHAPDGCYLNDMKGTFVDGNQAAEKIARVLRQRDPGLGLILVSGWRLGEQDPRRAPFDIYLPKPFAGLREIRDAIVRAMELRDEREARLKPALR